MAIICKNCGRPILGNVVKAKTGSWFSYQEYSCCGEKCRAELEANFAAKKEAKEAKKAAKQAAREEGEYESEGVSSSSAELPSGCVKIVGMILAFFVVCGILGMLFCKDEDTNDPAVKMAKWEEHLEKRRAAFAEGLSEEGVEARGLKNFTWEEWQNRSKAKAAEKPAEKVEDIAEKWHEHHKKRREFINSGHTKEEAEAAGFKNYTLDEFKQNYKNIKYKTLEEIRQSAAVPTTPATVPEKSTTPVDAAAEANTKPKALAESGAAASGQKDGDKHKPSKDSKGIRIVVQGKGKTKDAAVRWAIRDAVWKTVGTWVDSKTRIKENHDRVVAQVKTITESDVPKFEVIDTQMQNGGFVVKVRVSVSKKKIAPKFAEIFPDVFGNE